MLSPIHVQDKDERFEILINLRKQNETVLIEVSVKEGYLKQKVTDDLDNRLNTWHSSYIPIGGDQYIMLCVSIESFKWEKFINSDYIDEITEAISENIAPVEYE